jgi:hypothetical protein
MKSIIAFFHTLRTNTFKIFLSLSVGSIIISIIYFMVIFANEVLSVGKKKAMKGQILWHKVKRQYMNQILHMAKEKDRKFGFVLVFYGCILLIRF